jgi:P-type Ca2+ transporter type 2C
MINQLPTDSSAWHTTEANSILDQLQAEPDQGLSETEVETRIKQYGPNLLVDRGVKSPLLILLEQLSNPLVLLLLFAAFISAILGKADNVIAIMAIVILNAVLGLMQEYKAERAVAALKKMAAPLVRVRRNGGVLDVEPSTLVPGDIILLEAGNVIAADARLLESAILQVQEASLTGESQPVDKAIDILAGINLPLGDRHNMVYMGTSVTYGRGMAVVVTTGMHTELGRIAELIQSVKSEKTPLQRRMDELGVVLIQAAIAVMFLSVIVGLVAGQSLETVLLEAIAIAVAVVPEGLPAVVTVALALGSQRMLLCNALIRKLPAVETLGSVTTICSDKTGTLTQNRMTVTVVDVAGKRAQFDDVAKHNLLELGHVKGKQPNVTEAAHAIILTGSTLCNDAILEQQTEDIVVTGDPTEGALVLAAARYGQYKPYLDEILPRIGEVPFDSERKRMTTFHRFSPNGSAKSDERIIADLLGFNGQNYVMFTKGAVDSLLDVCSEVWVDGELMPMTDVLRERIELANNQLAQEGLRVLGLAYRIHEVLPDKYTASDEHRLVFVGMLGIIDPPRQEVADAVQVCKIAGIRPVMITGDHPLTALAIAHDLGIVGRDERILTGKDLNNLTETEFDENVQKVSVFARVSPEHKLKIVQSLQKQGHIVAMTGDGVNDAPALKRSHIGVAMGITGTGVSKEASDMVLLDDNFATIVKAVSEGRTIYDNVRRFIKYLLASNTGELFVLLVTQLISGMTIPLTTLQILWMNLITDGIPALALGIEKPEKGVMQRPPYAPNESLFGRGLGRHIVLIGLLLGGTGIALGYWAWSNNLRAANGAPAWNTMVFMFLTIAQMGHALGLRSHRESLFSLSFFGNPLLLVTVIITVILQMFAVYAPFFNNIFKTNPLTLEQLAICFALSTIVFWGVEVEKWAIRRGWLSS